MYIQSSAIQRTEALVKRKEGEDSTYAIVILLVLFEADVSEMSESLLAQIRARAFRIRQRKPKKCPSVPQSFGALVGERAGTITSN